MVGVIVIPGEWKAVLALYDVGVVMSLVVFLASQSIRYPSTTASLCD